jgi:hypothetical protein
MEQSQQMQQARRQFFSSKNEELLYSTLVKSYQQRLGSLNEKQKEHLGGSLEFFMSDVYEKNSYQPLPTLNKTVIGLTANEFNSYLQRQSSLANATPQMFMETSNRYEQIQNERQRTLEAPRPSIPDYVQPIIIKEDDSISALALYEEAKKRRESEMSQQASAEMDKRASSASTPIYATESQASQLAVRPSPRSMYDTPLDLVVAGTAPVYGPPASGRNDMNPTIARPPSGSLSAPGSRGTLQQDILIKQQDIQTYKETEYNLSVYSADRQWEFNTTENRFNFTVNLYSGNPTNGVSIMPKASARFRNIVKIEFVKAVMPIENTDIIVTKTNATTYSTAFDKNIFGFPFVTLTVDELDNNNFGTNNKMDNAFAILQYDANWTDNTGSMGFTSYIPKHMKCQRVYSPTPLASLSKLTVRLQQPNGNLISSVPDTLNIAGAYIGTSVPASITTNSSIYNTSGEYIFINTSKWFSVYQIAAGDRIQIRNLSAFTSPTAAQTDFLNYVQDSSGLMVVAVANTGTPTTLVDGVNAAGYANYIIIRNRFNDPTTGSVTVKPFGGAANNTTLATSLSTNVFTTGKLINLSRQTQLIFRIITRDYDSASLLRPDNL